jgi:hypothetical protein
MTKVPKIMLSTMAILQSTTRSHCDRHTSLSPRKPINQETIHCVGHDNNCICQECRNARLKEVFRAKFSRCPVRSLCPNCRANDSL